jgi:hypothetical protein
MLIDTLAGFIFATITAYFFHIQLTLEWLLLGALFALLPDVDFFIELAQRKTVGGKKLGAHRILTHIPLLFLLLGIVLFFLFEKEVVTLFALGAVWHFLHDAHAMGYGYRMLWPFSKKFYKFFSDREGKYCYDTKHFLVAWTQEEVEALHQKHGNDNWIQDHLRHHARRWWGPVRALLGFSVILFFLVLLAFIFLLFV